MEMILLQAFLQERLFIRRKSGRAPLFFEDLFVLCDLRMLPANDIFRGVNEIFPLLGTGPSYNHRQMVHYIHLILPLATTLK